MNNELAIPEEIILNKILLVRNKKVMLDRDLAELYNVKAIRLREQVKRNPAKFPGHFMFQLTQKETELLVSQNAIPSKKHLGGALPYVFTEFGILQLSNVLNSERATQMSIRIIEIFVKMRNILSSNREILKKLDELEQKGVERDEKIKLIFNYIRQFEELRKQELEQKNRRKIGFKIKNS